MKKIYNLLTLFITIFLFIGSVSAVESDFEIIMNADDSRNNIEIPGTTYIPGSPQHETYFKISHPFSSDKYDTGNKLLYCADATKSTPVAGISGYIEMDTSCVDITGDKAKKIAFIYENGYGTYKTSYSATDYLTGDYLNDYYITQAAIWYFTIPEDWMNGFDLSQGTFNGQSNATTQKISKLIRDAESATSGGSLTLSISNTKMGLTSDSKYYISDPIKITGKYLNSKVNVTVSGASGTFVTTDKNATSGSSSFDNNATIYIKVPTSSITGSSTTINLKASATTAIDNGKVIECGHNNYDVIQPVVIYYPSNKTLNANTSVTASKLPVKISKEDITNSKEIEGAKLSLKSGNTELSWTSTNKPYPVYLDPGTYTLSETIAPTGYKKTTTTIKFELKENGKVYVDGKEVSEVVMNNDPITVTISKKDIAGSGELAGAKLRITDKDGNTVKDIAGNNLEWISETKPKTFHIAAGTYLLEETVAPLGYKKTTTKVEFTVNDDGKVLVGDSEVSEVVITNEMITITISKRSITGDNELAGAKLKITNENGEIAKDINGNDLEWISGETPKIINLVAGTYKLTETIAPEGYELSETEIIFTVTEDGVVMSNGKEIENNLIIFENTPEPEPVPTGNAFIYIAIGLGVIAIGIVTYIIIKNYKK